MSDGEIRTCEDALRLLATHVDGELPPDTHDEMERHLSTCRSCYSRAEFERRLKEQVAGVGREPVRPELAERVQALIESFTPAGPE